VLEGKVFRLTDSLTNLDTIGIHVQPIVCLTVDNSGRIYTGLPGAGVLASDNAGLNWDLKNMGIAATNVSAIYGSNNVGGVIRVVTNEGQAHESTDKGNTWKDETHNLGYTFANGKNSLAVSGITKTWFFATAYGTYRKLNNDDDWEPTGFTFNGVKADDMGNYYGWAARNLFKSTDDAVTFNLLTTAPFNIDNIVFNKDNDILASIQFNLGNGIYKYENNNWSEYNNGLTNLNVTSLNKLNVTLSASYCTRAITCGTTNGKFFALDEDTDVWNEFSVGLQSTFKIKYIGGYYDQNQKYYTDVIDGGVHRLKEDNCNFSNVDFPAGYELTTGLYWQDPQEAIGFYGTTGGGILRRSLLVDVKEQNNEIPTVFNLEQNYPNPFNPSTTIRFAIPKESFTRLETYNALGEKVSTLVSENLSSGTYEYEWNVEGLPSGIYFYKLSTDNFSEMKKMILLR
jgi:hypothetical protein